LIDTLGGSRAAVFFFLVVFAACLPTMDHASPGRPDTPCVAVCSTTFDDMCRGCGRTVVEVAEWVFMSDDDKEKVWQRITAQGYPRRNT
jgi:predicted Fe-S protein YdhL (DUF1289 family)